MNILQIGCNDCNDHVFKFVSNNADKINYFFIIDALPKCIEDAKNVYSFIEKLIPINVAVSNYNGLTNFYFPSDDDKSGHASMSKDHVFRHNHQKLETNVVPCININYLFATLNMEIERFYIDIEGYDVDILLSLDFNRFKPKYIEYECYHSDGTFSNGGEKNNKLLKILDDNGYHYKSDGQYNIIAELNQ
jgi:FkbM family methyltransferase